MLGLYGLVKNSLKERKFCKPNPNSNPVTKYNLNLNNVNC